MGLKDFSLGNRAKASAQASFNSTVLALSVYDNASDDDFAELPSGAGNVFVYTIEDERILCYQRTGNAITVYDEDTHLLGYLSAGENGRGYDGSTPASHDGDVQGALNIGKVELDAIQAAIIADETNLATNYYTKAEINVLLESKNTKDEVEAATNAAGTLASDFEDGDTIDGVLLATGDRILIKDQATATENGVYVVAASGAPSRSDDADTGEKLDSAIVPVKAGTANENSLWLQTTDDPTIGASNIVFAQIGQTLDKANEATARGGLDDSDYMTALKTKYSIETFSASLESFIFGETISAMDALSPINLSRVLVGDIDVTDDTYVDSGNATTNYDGVDPIEAQGSGGVEKHILLKFDSGLPADLLQILSFDLKINISAKDTGSQTYQVKPATSAWTSAAVTWNTKPTLGSSMGSNVVAATGLDTVACTVPTEAVSDDIIANGLAIVVTNPAAGFIRIESLESVGTAHAKITTITYVGVDGKVHKVDANFSFSVDNFIGFANEAGILDDEKFVRTGGIMTSTGLTPRSTYYLSDTPGEISSSPGTNSKKIGRAITATQLLIVQPPL